jgi:transaldolase
MRNFKIKIFADGANYNEIKYFNSQKIVKGLTTNPSLMRKSGVKNYEIFARKVLRFVKHKPISFEVFSDDFEEMYAQAKTISSWGKNVYVKIPVTNTKGKSSHLLIKKLSDEGINLNITAIFNFYQVSRVIKFLNPKSKAIVSIFSGRIADTGINPEIVIKKSVDLLKNNKNHEILWASTRELYNVVQAEKIKCHIITVPTTILKKFNLLGYDLIKYSADTVKEFYEDAKNAKFKI